LAQAQARGWLAREGARIRATELGQRFLNDVIELFLPDKPASRAHRGPPRD
jgi:oxygen-independent coproporphyrinogen-3 oxidase